MSEWIVKHRPAGPVHPGHVAEARRARRPAALPDEARLEDARLEDALWAARALPPLLDALGDVRAGLRLDRLAFRSVLVERKARVLPNEALVAIALCAPGTLEAEVRFLPIEGHAPRYETPVRVRFVFDDAPPGDDPSLGVSIQRFRAGPPGR